MDGQSHSLEPSLEKQLKGHRNSITALFFNPNDQQLASSSLDNSILLWDLRGTMRSYKFQGHDEAVMDVTFSPSGKFMASASRDKTVRLWVPTVTGSTGVFKAHSQTVRSVQFSSDGSKIITASDDKIIKMWSSDKHKFMSSFVGHTNWVRRACMSQDCSLLASCSDDKTTRIWNPETGECIHTYKDPKGYGVYLAWHPSSCYVAVGTSHGNVKLYDVRTHNLVQYYSIHNDAVTQLAFHPSGSYILTASKDGKMKILDLLEGHPVFTLSGHEGAVNAASFSSSGNLFATAGDDKLVFIWQTNFTDVANELKENVAQNPITTSKAQTLKIGQSAKGARIWYQCYHSLKYPVITFDHIDDEQQNVSVRMSFTDIPNANSTMVDSRQPIDVQNTPRTTSTPINNSQKYSTNNHTAHGECQSDVCSSYSVGHSSHIPRTPPSRATYTIPSIVNKSIGLNTEEDELFGVIKLGENDVCYTSGTIEWVGRKRCFPINSGFKTLNSNLTENHQPLLKRKKHNISGVNNVKECDCADVLPTVNAIVDHLNALHEAVDIVDLRLNTVEDFMSKND